MIEANVKKLVLCATVCLAAAGCEKVANWFPTFKEKNALEKAVDEASRPEADTVVGEPQTSAELLAFRHHVEAVTKLLTGEMAVAANRLTEVQSDSDALAKAMSSVASQGLADGLSGGRKDALVALLKDDAVNALARRYLRRSFSLVALEVEERVGEAETAERRRRSELNANAAAAKAAVESAKDEDRRARASVLEGERKLKRELENLRRRKSKLENELNMVAASDRNRKRQEIREVHLEIQRMEREYDGLRSSSAVNREVQRSEEQVRRAQLAADSRRIRADSEFGKAGAVMSPADVVAEFEASTVLALEKAIADALSHAAAKKVRIARAADYVKAVGDVRKSLASSALQSIRAEIDSRVSAALEDSK